MSARATARRGKAAPVPAGLAAREAAVALIDAVIGEKRPLDGLIDAGFAGLDRLDPRERALARAIVGATLRRHGEIEAALGRLIERPLPKRAGRIAAILKASAAQILYMDVPDHAAVSLALLLAERDGGARHFKGLANAVLRRLARERTLLSADLDAFLLNTPDWLWRRWRERYGEATARAIAQVHLLEPYLDLSVKADAAGWAERLGGAVLPNGTVRLIPSGPVEALAGYEEGAWWVQDAAASLPVRLLGDVAGRDVADLCAERGGKSAALAAAGARVTAVDSSSARIARMKANFDRLGLAAGTVAADAAAWSPGRTFDAVLLDAPCLATGTIRRHPDVALLKQPGDLATLAALQARLLDRAADLVKPGGLLVYCVCSLEPEEGEAQMERALATLPLDLVPAEPSEIGGLSGVVTPEGALRTLPCHLPADEPRRGGLDGFFAVRFRRR